MAADDNSQDVRRRKQREQRARRALERRREQAWVAETLIQARQQHGTYKGATVAQLEDLLALVIRCLIEELGKAEPRQGYYAVARQVLYDQGVAVDRTATSQELRERLAKLH